MGEDLTYTDGVTQIRVRGGEALVEDLSGDDLTGVAGVGCGLALVVVPLGVVLLFLHYAYVTFGDVGLRIISALFWLLMISVVIWCRFDARRSPTPEPAPPLGPGSFRRVGPDLVITKAKGRRSKTEVMPAPAGLAVAIEPTGYDGVRRSAILFRLDDGTFRAIAIFGIERDRRRRVELERVGAGVAGALGLPFLGRIPMPDSERRDLDLA